MLKISQESPEDVVRFQACSSLSPNFYENENALSPSRRILIFLQLPVASQVALGPAELLR